VSGVCLCPWMPRGSLAGLKPLASLARFGAAFAAGAGKVSGSSKETAFADKNPDSRDVDSPAAVLGAYAYMGPKAGRDIFSIAPETSDVTFGAVTVLTGVAGTLGGGLLLDRLGSSIPNALGVCGWAAAAGCLFVALSFVLPRTLGGFVPLFALGELALFATQVGHRSGGWCKNGIAVFALGHRCVHIGAGWQVLL
jgi:hypothetical protein